MPARQGEGRASTELAIFAATERLLARVPLHELSVAEIIEEAGVSRATFYAYFSSKFAVVSGLLSRVMDDVFEVAQTFLNRAEGVSPVDALRASLADAIALWAEHQPAMRAVHEHWNTTAELRSLWMSIVERYTSALANEIDRERTSGLAAPGVDSRRLAASLLWSTEQCLYVAGLGVQSALPREDVLLEPLLAIWVGAILGAGSGIPAPAG